MLEFQCPHCSEILSIPEQFVGSTGTCRKCRKTITIEPASTQDTEAEFNGMSSTRPPTLAVLHIETTGPSSRRCDIIELGAIKIDLSGRELDTFWNFANPDKEIPEKITERTGITDDMVAAAPFSHETVKEFFEWLGPHTILFADHAHFHSKFLSACLYREDVVPPATQIVDVVRWAEELEIDVPEYKLRKLLDAVGYPIQDTYRSMDICRGLALLVPNLIKKYAGNTVASGHNGNTGSVFGKMLGRKVPAVDERAVYDALTKLSRPIAQMCGSDFHAQEAYEERRQRERDGKPAKEAIDLGFLHVPEWYDERKRMLDHARIEASQETPQPTVVRPEDVEWERALLEASQSVDPDEQRRYLTRAVTLGARDPWPYERLAGFFIKSRDYLAAQKVCEQYFEGDTWKIPRHAHSSLKLLQRMEKLERRLSAAAQ